MTRRRLLADALIGGVWALAFALVALLGSEGTPAWMVVVTALVMWPLMAVVGHWAGALGHRVFDPRD